MQVQRSVFLVERSYETQKKIFPLLRNSNYIIITLIKAYLTLIS